MQQVKITKYPSNSFRRFWVKVPLVVRSVLIGFGVTSIGVGIWVLLATYVPVPWSVLAMGAILIPYWMYFRGRWNPSSTKDFRRFCIRQTNLKRPVWIWGLMAAFFIFLFLNAGWILTFRIVQFQPEVFKTARYLNDYPAWASWSVILMASLVAGLCEETGYRGYMQAPIEQKYGPVAGISITSLVFAAAHLHQAWASGMFVGIFVLSFMIGYLAYATNSLLFGILSHVAFDLVNFSYWWSDVAGSFERKPIRVTGVDNHFILTLSVVLLSILLFVFAIRTLLKLKARDNLIGHTCL
jgi:membrane protease YdiL (CAAX protease family)